MRRTLILALALCLLCSVTALGEEQQTVSGFVMDRDAYHAMEEKFREGTFGGETQSVELTDTQTLLFVSEDPVHILPAFTVLIGDHVGLSEDANETIAVVQSLIETMQRLQFQYPEAFMFNQERAMTHAETGLSFAVADTDLWLWASDASAVMLPFYLYDNTSGELADDIFLLSIVIAGPETAYYAVYTNPLHVIDYLMAVEMDTQQGAFQRAVIYWYLNNFVDEDALAQMNASDGTEMETAEMTGLGTVIVTVKKGNARAKDREDAELIGTVHKDEVYQIVSISPNGWFEIMLADGSLAFISPGLVEQQE